MLGLTAAAAGLAVAGPLRAASVDWTGAGANTAWHTVGNWTSNPALPSAADTVTIGAVPLVSFGGVGVPVASVLSLVSLADSFRLQTGVLTLAQASSFAQLTHSGGALRGSGAVTVDTAQLNGGAWLDGGTLLLAAGGSHSLGGGGFNADGGRLIRNEGTATVDAGPSVNWTAELNDAPGYADLAGAARIENAGTLRFVSYLNRTASVVATNQGLADQGGASVLNTGTVEKTGAGTVSFYTAFHNQGVLNLSADAAYGNTYGSFALRGGSTHAAGSRIGGSGHLMLIEGAHSFASGAQVDVAKLTTFGSSSDVSLLAGSVFTPGSLTMQFSSTLRVKAGATFAPGALDQSGGVLDLEGNSLSLPDASVFNSGALRGSGVVTVRGVQLKGGTLRDAGTLLLAAGSSHSLSGGLTLDGGRVLRNEGTATIASGNANYAMDLNSAAGWGNQAGAGRFENAGTLNLQTVLNRRIDFTATNQGLGDHTAARLVNTGSIVQTGDGSSWVIVDLVNSGRIDIGAGYSGTMQVASDTGTGVGRLDNLAGGSIQGAGQLMLTGQGHALRSGSAVTVDRLTLWGTLTIEDGVDFRPGDFHVRTLAYDTVTKVGSQSLVWRGGGLDMGGHLVLQQNAPLIVQGGYLAGSGYINMLGAATASTPAVVVRAGAVLDPGNSAISTFGFSAGTLTVDGGVQFDTGSELEIDLVYGGGAVGNPLVYQDKLVSSGVVTLAGTLSVDLNTTLAAQNLQGRSFTVLSARQIVGTFDHFAGLGDWGAGGEWGYQLEYLDGNDADTLADSVRITFNAVPLPPPPVPEPATAWLALAGLCGLSGLSGLKKKARRAARA